MGKNTSKQPKKGGTDSQDREQDITTFDNLESELSNLTEEKPLEINFDSIEISRQSRQAKAPQTLYPGQIIYGSDPISRKLVDNLSQPNPNLTTSEIPSSLAQFTSTCVAQSHIHLVYT